MKNKIILSVMCASLLLTTTGYAKSQSNNTQKQYKKNKSKKGKNMNKTIRNGFVTASAALAMSGCNSNTNNVNNSIDGEPSVEAAISAPLSTLSEELTNTLSYMGNEERLAYDVYNKLYAEWGTKQFTNIATKSEVKHITAVQDLIKKYKLIDSVQFTNVDLPALGYMNTPIDEMKAGTYDIAKIQRLYDDLISQGSTSEEEALKVGCIVEVVDVEDLDAYIKIAEESNAQDVVDVFNFLRDGSYNHYWAFDKGLKNKGINEGCCTWKGENGTLNLCHPEYPQKEKGKGKAKN